MFEDKSCYKIELEMELGHSLISLHCARKDLSIFSYFENKMEIPLLLFKEQKKYD